MYYQQLTKHVPILRGSLYGSIIYMHYSILPFFPTQALDIGDIEVITLNQSRKLIQIGNYGYKEFLTSFFPSLELRVWLARISHSTCSFQQW